MGEDFLQRALDADAAHELLSTAITHSLWPVVDSQQVYSDLIRLAAQLTLLGSRRYRLRSTMQNSFDPSSWTLARIQFEMAGLALRDGWDARFEQPQGRGRLDVLLTRGEAIMVVEVASMGMSVREHEALTYFRNVSWQLLGIEMRHGVQVIGRLGDVAPPEVADNWVKEIEAAADEVARDGVERQVAGPAGADVSVRSAVLGPGETLLEGAAVLSEPWARLGARISEKARQTNGASNVWIRVEDHAGLLWFSPLALMPIADRLAALAPHLRAALEPHPHVGGIILPQAR